MSNNKKLTFNNFLHGGKKNIKIQSGGGINWGEKLGVDWGTSITNMNTDGSYSNATQIKNLLDVIGKAAAAPPPPALATEKTFFHAFAYNNSSNTAYTNNELSTDLNIAVSTYDPVMSQINYLFNSKFIFDFTFERNSCVLKGDRLPTFKTKSILGSAVAGVGGIGAYGNLIIDADGYNGKIKLHDGLSHYYAFHTLLLYIFNKVEKLPENTDIENSEKEIAKSYISMFIRINMLLYLNYLVCNKKNVEINNDNKSKIAEKINLVLKDWNKFKVNIPVIERFVSNLNQSYKIYRVLKIYLSLIVLTTQNINKEVSDKDLSGFNIPEYWISLNYKKVEQILSLVSSLCTNITPSIHLGVVRNYENYGISEYKIGTKFGSGSVSVQLNAVKGGNAKIQFDVEIDNKDNDYEDDLVEMTFAEEDNINITAFRDMLNTTQHYGRIGGQTNNNGPAELYLLASALDYYNDIGTIFGTNPQVTSVPHASISDKLVSKGLANTVGYTTVGAAYDNAIAVPPNTDCYRDNGAAAAPGLKSNQNTFDVIEEYFNLFDRIMIETNRVKYTTFLRNFKNMLCDMKARRTFNTWIYETPDSDTLLHGGNTENVNNDDSFFQDTAVLSNIEETKASQIAVEFLQSINQMRNNTDAISTALITKGFLLNSPYMKWRSFECFIVLVTQVFGGAVTTLPSQIAINYIKQKFLNSFFKHAHNHFFYVPRNILNNHKLILSQLTNNLNLNLGIIANKQNTALLCNVLEVDILLNRKKFGQSGNAPLGVGQKFKGIDLDQDLYTQNTANSPNRFRTYNNIIRYWERTLGQLQSGLALTIKTLAASKYTHVFINNDVKTRCIYRINNVDTLNFPSHAIAPIAVAANIAAAPPNAYPPDNNVNSNYGSNVVLNRIPISWAQAPLAVGGGTIHVSKNGDERLNKVVNIVEHWFNLLEYRVISSGDLRDIYKRLLVLWLLNFDHLFNSPITINYWTGVDDNTEFDTNGRNHILNSLPYGQNNYNQIVTELYGVAIGAGGTTDGIINDYILLQFESFCIAVCKLSPVFKEYVRARLNFSKILLNNYEYSQTKYLTIPLSITPNSKAVLIYRRFNNTNTNNLTSVPCLMFDLVNRVFFKAAYLRDYTQNDTANRAEFSGPLSNSVQNNSFFRINDEGLIVSDGRIECVVPLYNTSKDTGRLNNGDMKTLANGVPAAATAAAAATGEPYRNRVRFMKLTVFKILMALMSDTSVQDIMKYVSDVRNKDNVFKELNKELSQQVIGVNDFKLQHSVVNDDKKGLKKMATTMYQNMSSVM